MHLRGVKQDDGWLFSRWELTYPVGWHNIIRGVESSYDYYDSPEILSGGEPVNIGRKEDISKIEENATMTIRGMSKIVKIPIMITFYNQVQSVDVNVPLGADGLNDTDYEKFNHSLCQYMDSIELTMLGKT